MSYAVRNDGLGWRCVDGPEDCTEIEVWQEEQPPIVNPPVPLQERIDAECRKEGIANEVMLEGLMAGMFALGLLNNKTLQQLADENAAFKKGLALRTLFSQWRAEAQ